MLMNNVMGTVTQGVAMAAPQLTLTVSDSLQTVLRGIAVVIVALLLIMLLVKNMNFAGRGGGGNKMKPATIAVALLVAAMLMDVELFITGLNWVLAVLFEVSQWIGDFFSETAGGSSGGTVDIK